MAIQDFINQHPYFNNQVNTSGQQAYTPMAPMYDYSSDPRFQPYRPTPAQPDLLTPPPGLPELPALLENDPGSFGTGTGPDGVGGPGTHGYQGFTQPGAATNPISGAASVMQGNIFGPVMDAFGLNVSNIFGGPSAEDQAAAANALAAQQAWALLNQGGASTGLAGNPGYNEQGQFVGPQGNVSATGPMSALQMQTPQQLLALADMRSTDPDPLNNIDPNMVIAALAMQANEGPSGQGNFGVSADAAAASEAADGDMFGDPGLAWG
jgi:hypothetical protein